MSKIRRVARKVFNQETGRPLPCCWNDCMRDGTTLYMAREHEKDGTEIRYVFCSERHKMFWVNSSRDMGNLPPGYRMTVT